MTNNMASSQLIPRGDSYKDGFNEVSIVLESCWETSMVVLDSLGDKFDRRSAKILTKLPQMHSKNWANTRKYEYSTRNHQMKTHFGAQRYSSIANFCSFALNTFKQRLDHQ